MFLSSLHFSFLAKLKIWQTTETYPSQTFSVTAAVVAPAVVICLKSLLLPLWYRWTYQSPAPNIRS